LEAIGLSGGSLEKKALIGAVAFAALALAFLVWLLFVAVPAGQGPAWVALLPASDAFCNAASALCAIAGFVAIRRGRRRGHRALMLAALAWSAVFLAGYVVFHHFRGDTHFAGHGWIRAFYLGLLISHVLLSFVVLPLLLATVAFAGLNVFEKHRRLARWTLPLWLYVSVTGVVVYFFLRSSY
jgi:putative membrane protein